MRSRFFLESGEGKPTITKRFSNLVDAKRKHEGDIAKIQAANRHLGTVFASSGLHRGHVDTLSLGPIKPVYYSNTSDWALLKVDLTELAITHFVIMKPLLRLAMQEHTSRSTWRVGTRLHQAGISSRRGVMGSKQVYSESSSRISISEMGRCSEHVSSKALTDLSCTET